MIVKVTPVLSGVLDEGSISAAKYYILAGENGSETIGQKTLFEAENELSRAQAVGDENEINLWSEIVKKIQEKREQMREIIN